MQSSLGRVPTGFSKLMAQYPWLFLAAAFFLVNQSIEWGILKTNHLSYENLCAWDCGWYRSIMENGYDSVASYGDRRDGANWAFFPVFPVIAKALMVLFGISSVLALIVTGKIFFFLSLAALLRFSFICFPNLDLFCLASIASFNPYSIYGNVAYSEPVFLFISALFFTSLLRGNFLQAGLSSAFLSATRFVGMSGAICYLIWILRNFRRFPNEEKPRIWLGFLLTPLGLSIFMVFLHLKVGDALAFSHIQIHWSRIPDNPLNHLWSGFHFLRVETYWSVLSLMAILLAVRLAFERHWELAMFSLVSTLLPLATGLWAMPRYIAWQVPILLSVASLIPSRYGRMFFPMVLIPTLFYMYNLWFSGAQIAV